MEPSEPLSKTRKSQIPNSTDDRSPHIYPYRNDIISINYLISRIDDALEAQVASFSCFSNFLLKRRSDLTLKNHTYLYARSHIEGFIRGHKSKIARTRKKGFKIPILSYKWRILSWQFLYIFDKKTLQTYF